MTDALFYPPADRAAQWFGGEFPGISMTMAKPKLVLHTTETAGGWPGYGGGAAGPTLTYEPWLHRWRQHFRIPQSARALQDPTPTPVRENRADAVQVEISCYCDPDRFPTGRGINNLDDQAYADLGRFAAWLHVEWGLPLRADVVWLPYPKSYGAGNGVRFSSTDYAAYSGVLGHQHVSGNVHGDPGNLDVPRILGCARAELTRGLRIDRALAALGGARTVGDAARQQNVKKAIDALEQIPQSLK